jgi:uncharacterized membrane protein
MRTPTQLKVFFTAALIALGTLTALAQRTTPAQVAGPRQPKRTAVASAVPEIGQGRGANSMDSNLPLFLPAATYGSGGSTPWSIAIADINGDNKPDLVVANSGTNAHGSLGVLLGRGDSTFGKAVTYDSGGDSAYSVVAADLNSDNKIDLVVANGTGVGVLLGNGDGTFQAAVTYASGGFGAISVSVGDVNGDGKPDLVVGNNSIDGISPEGSVAVLLGNGNGTFQAPVSYDSGGQSANSVALSDVNGDRKPDLLVSNQCENPDNCTKGLLGVLLGNGDGTFHPVATYDSGGYNSTSIAVDDLNGDGKPDLVAFNICNALGNDCTSGAVGVLLGNGDGTFQPAQSYNSGGPGGGDGFVAVADVNADGRPDVLDVNSSSFGSGRVGVLLGNGDGTLQAAVNHDSGGSTPRGLAVADLNGDTLPDVVVAECAVSGCDNGDLVGILLHVGATPTTATLASTPNPSFFGQFVTFTATVTSASGNPTGSVMFFDNSTALGSATLVNGRAWTSVSTLAAGSHSITAVYQGSLKFNSSESAPLQQIVNRAIAATSTALVSNLNPSIYGQAVTFTAVVSSTGGVPPNGETVTFFKNSNVLGIATLNAGAASLTTSALQSGIFTITALYGGDANFAASTSPGPRQFVDTKSQLATATTLASSLNPSIYGQNVTWTARVTTSGGSMPTGKINFISGTNNIGTVTLNASGVATLSKSNLSADPYPLTAVYLGDANNGPSASPIVNQVVKQTTSSAGLTSSPNPSTNGQAVTFTATIKSPTVIPTGPVTFMVGRKVLGTVQLSGGNAKFTISTLAGGSSKITATYYGNSNIAKSSASVIQTVQ